MHQQQQHQLYASLLKNTNHGFSNKVTPLIPLDLNSRALKASQFSKSELKVLYERYHQSINTKTGTSPFYLCISIYIYMYFYLDSLTIYHLSTYNLSINVSTYPSIYLSIHTSISTRLLTSPIYILTILP